MERERHDLEAAREQDQFELGDRIARRLMWENRINDPLISAIRHRFVAVRR